MKNKLFTLLAIFALFMSTIGMIHAAPTTYIIDEFNVLSDDEINRMNDQAEKIEKESGIGVYFAYLENSEISDLDVTSIVGDKKDYFLMAENEEIWIIRAGGIMEEKVTDVDGDAFRKAYDREDTYIGGVKAYLENVEQFIEDEEINVTVQPSEQDNDSQSGANEQNSTQENVTDNKESIVVKTSSNLYDGADLLSTDEENSLKQEIDEIIKKHNVDIAIATVQTTGNKAIDDYIAEYYDINGFGTGENRDGVLFLISMSERQYRILSNGLGAQAISSDDITSIGNNIVSDLTDGNYASAFHTFLSDCEYEINGEINGFPFPFGMNATIAAVGGFIVSLFTTGSMKNQLKSVSKQNKAKDYMKPGSMNLENSNEFFLYRTVSSQRKAKDDSNSSSRSSGSSRNVGGGSF